MTNKVKVSMTAKSGVERSQVRLLEREGVSVSYDFTRAELIYSIPTGYTIGELRDWRAKYNLDILPTLSKKGIVPSERLLRELHSPVVIHKKRTSVKKEGIYEL
jgi:hypothetical protein